MAAVTIGIPTRNRARLLRTALSSALRQTHADLRIIVSDNDSTDETSHVVAEICDSRVEYVRQRPAGTATTNLLALLELVDTPAFMWLADDDELGDEYVERCLTALGAQSWVCACGITEYVDERGRVLLAEGGDVLDATSENPLRRAAQVLARINYNSAFYGLLDTGAARAAATALDGTFADDWAFTAGLAFAGKIGVAPGATMRRSTAGSSSDIEALARRSGLSGRCLQYPFSTVGRKIARMAICGDGTFAEAPLRRRAAVAAMAVAEMERRFRVEPAVYRAKTGIRHILSGR